MSNEDQALAVQSGEPIEKLIVVRQLPIIEERLKLISDKVKKDTDTALSMPCTEDTLASVKRMRTKLTKDFDDLETQRKAVKKMVLAPYEQFEATYKKYITNVFNPADAKLKSRIDGVQNDLKEAKRIDVAAYFSEYAASKNIDWLPFERAGIDVKMSDTPKSLRARAKTFIDGVSDDLAMIETQELYSEILVEYKRSLNASNAITTVCARHEAMEAEQRRQDEMRAARERQAETIQKVQAAAAADSPEQLSIPQEAESVGQRPDEPATEKMYRAAFTVTATLPMLRELKRYLEDGGYEYVTGK